VNTATAMNEKWSEEMVPILNGVVFPDGKLIPMMLEDGRLKTLEYSSWNPKELDEQWSYVTELCRVSIPSRSLDVVAGEGGLGTDGVVVLLNTRDNSVQWVLFMDNSNPFDQIRVDGAFIAVTSTLGYVWTIDLENPANTRVASALHA
jgi:hypothetical protein